MTEVICFMADVGMFIFPSEMVKVGGRGVLEEH